MKIPEINFLQAMALELDRFREMDYYAIKNYNLPIELMMENAGLQLANLVACFADKTHKITIGIGNGNNGGGGLVAARRLAAWGYQVFLNPFTSITKELPRTQFERAIKFGAKDEVLANPDVWVDAYLGFSQRLPLEPSLENIIKEANRSKALRISLDIPTGFLGDTSFPYFEADKILTLAAPKKILYKLGKGTKIYVADIGIPQEIYAKFGVDPLPFYQANILRLL